MENEEEYARLLDCCEATRKEWAKHWQCDEEVQDVEEKLWKNEELRSAEEALPRLKECHLEEVSRLKEAKTVDRHTYRAPHFPMDSCCTAVFFTCCQSVQSHIDFHALAWLESRNTLSPFRAKSFTLQNLTPHTGTPSSPFLNQSSSNLNNPAKINGTS